MGYRGRRLTANEIAIARTVYGDSINYRAIRINSNLYPIVFKILCHSSKICKNRNDYYDQITTQDPKPNWGLRF